MPQRHRAIQKAEGLCVRERAAEKQLRQDSQDRAARDRRQENKYLKREDRMSDRLKGKVALVVGAGSVGPGWGNGKATAVAFAREGAKVFCADINLGAAEETAALIKKEGGEARAHKADVTKAAEVAAMVAACSKAYG